MSKKKYKQQVEDVVCHELADNTQGKFAFQFINEYQREAWDLIHKQENKLIFLIGAAGCGKSWLATCAACNSVLQKRTRKIHLVRPYVAVESYGYLPGILADKLAPVLQPIQDIIEDLTGVGTDRKRIENSVVFEGLGWLRGRTFNNWVVGDEIQNCDFNQIKLLTTRIGKGCKMILTGDPFQSDIKNSGMMNFINYIKDVEGVVVYQLPPQAQVREPIVQRILDKLP